MGVRSPVLHHPERGGRWVLAWQSRHHDRVPADYAGGLRPRVREDGWGTSRGSPNARHGAAARDGRRVDDTRARERLSRRDAARRRTHGDAPHRRARGDRICADRLASAWCLSRLGSPGAFPACGRSEEHTSELQSHLNLVCRLLLEKKKKKNINNTVRKKKKKKNTKKK